MNRMEHLVFDLREKLILRKKIELALMKEYDKKKNKELVLISTGKIIELDQLISFLDNMLYYHNQTKEIS
jgi:hypothetical protein